MQIMSRKLSDWVTVFELVDRALVKLKLEEPLHAQPIFAYIK